MAARVNGGGWVNSDGPRGARPVLVPALLAMALLPQVARAQPAIGVNLAALTPATVTRPDVSPPNLQLTVTNTGDAPLTYTVSFPAGQWIRNVSPPGWTLAPSASCIHTVSFDTSGMTFNGLFSLVIRVGTAQAGVAVPSVDVPVNLTVDLVPLPPDEDLDGVPDAQDGCPLDPEKTAAGQCGCGWPDTDTDQDTIADCNDNCIYHENPLQEDEDGDGIGDVCEPLYLEELAEAEAQGGEPSSPAATATPGLAAAPPDSPGGGAQAAAGHGGGGPAVTKNDEYMALGHGEEPVGGPTAAPLPAACGAGLLEAMLAGLASLGAVRAVRTRSVRR